MTAMWNLALGLFFLALAIAIFVVAVWLEKKL